MSESKKEVTQLKKELVDVDVLAKRKGIDEVILAGVKALRGWKKLKKVTEEEFDLAVEEFLNQTV